MERRPNIISPILTTIGGLSPLRDGEQLPGGAVRIVDRHSSFYPIAAGNGKYILIDAGMDSKGRKLDRFMNEREFNESDILAGFITHAHSDHVGGFKRFNSMPIYIGGDDIEVILGNKRSQGPMPKMFDLLPGYLGAMIPDLQPRIIDDDEVIEIGNLTVRAIAMKGHTDGSMGYLVGNRDSGDYIFHAGDAFDHSRRANLKYPPRAVSVSMSRKTSEDSIVKATRRIIDLGIEPRAVITSHSGHGSFRSMKQFSNLRPSKVAIN